MVGEGMVFSTRIAAHHTLIVCFILRTATLIQPFKM